MASVRVRLRRRFRTAARRLREARMVARALGSPDRPVLAQVVPIRRCNLSCSYCNEFDDYSPPVPLPEMAARIDRLAALGTMMIDLSGGEPLLHPELDAIVARIRRHGILAGLLTNGYLLTRERIERLNRAGLDHLQVSIDNVTPDAVSKKSLKVLDTRLALLAAHADFDVNVNIVVGGGVTKPEEAIAIARRALALGLTATVGLIHDGSGQLRPLDGGARAAFDAIERLTKPFFSMARHNPFQRQLAMGRANAWHCPAGGRYLYVCEDGLVHWCSQQRGCPGIPLADYTAADLARQRQIEKSCAPFCTISCVHRVALLDRLRARPAEALEELMDAPRAYGLEPPRLARALRWMFVTGPNRDRFRAMAARLLNVK